MTKYYCNKCGVEMNEKEWRRAVPLYLSVESGNKDGIWYTKKIDLCGSCVETIMSQCAIEPTDLTNEDEALPF